MRGSEHEAVGVVHIGSYQGEDLTFCEGAFDARGGGIISVRSDDYVAQDSPPWHAASCSLSGAMEGVRFHMPVCNVGDSEFGFDVVACFAEGLCK